MGETPKECQQRYGAAVTNYAGHGNLDGVAIYVKDDISVTAFFTKAADKSVRATLIIYAHIQPDIQTPSAFRSEFTEAQQAALLATVPGRWSGYDPPPTLAGRPAALKPISTEPSLTIRHRNLAANVLGIAMKALRSLAPTNLSPTDREILSPPAHIAHNGPRLFAYRMAGRIAIFSMDGADPIRLWAERVASERTAAQTPPEKKLSGF